jgi:endoglucanase
MTYLTPHANQSGHFKGDLSPLGVQVDASGGWWDAGDYLKFLQTTSYTADLLLAGVRDFPAEMGAGAGASNFSDEAKFRRRLAAPDVGRRFRRPSTTRSASGRGTRRPWATTTSGDSRRRTTRSVGPTRVYRYIRDRPVFRAGAPGSPISPNLAGRDAGHWPCASRTTRHRIRPSPTGCLTSAEDIFDLVDTNPPKQLLTVIPVQLLSRNRVRDDLELAATELYFALAAGNVPRGLQHTDPLYYLGWRRTGRTSTSPGRATAADSLNLYDVSGFAHYDLYRGHRTGGKPPGPGGDPGRPLRGT